MVLDERGKEATSEGLAKLLAKVICRAIASGPCDGPTPAKLSLSTCQIHLLHYAPDLRIGRHAMNG